MSQPKYYKILRERNGRLYSYNAHQGEPLCLRYFKTKWTLPKIEGSQIFVLKKPTSTSEQIWEIEIGREIKMEDGFVVDFNYSDSKHLKHLIQNNLKPNKFHIAAVRRIFPDTVLTDKVKLLKRIS